MPNNKTDPFVSEVIAICIICTELLKHKMIISEAERNLREIISDSTEHEKELLKALEEMDLEKLNEVLIE